MTVYVAALSALAIFGPPRTIEWLRVVSNCLAALIALVVCAVIYGLIRDRLAGHKTLCRVGLAYFVWRAVIHFWIAGQWVVGGERLPLVVAVITNAIEIVLGCYVFAIRADILATFHRSEARRREIADIVSDREQVAIQTRYIASSLKAQSYEQSELINNVGRGC